MKPQANQLRKAVLPLARATANFLRSCTGKFSERPNPNDSVQVTITWEQVSALTQLLGKTAELLNVVQEMEKVLPREQND